jgi:hypothetical protein
MDVKQEITHALDTYRMENNAALIESLTSSDHEKICQTCPGCNRWQQLYFEMASALGVAHQKIAALEAIIKEDDKLLDDMDEVERVAFLQKHFGYNWTKHI